MFAWRKQLSLSQHQHWGSCSCECPKMKQKTHRAPSCLKRRVSRLCEGPRKAAAAPRLAETPARAWRQGWCTFCRSCSLQKAGMLMSPVGEGHQGMPESVPRGALRSCQHRGAVQASDKRCSAQKAGSRAPSGEPQLSVGCLVSRCLRGWAESGHGTLGSFAPCCLSPALLIPSHPWALGLVVPQQHHSPAPCHPLIPGTLSKTGLVELCLTCESRVPRLCCPFGKP